MLVAGIDGCRGGWVGVRLDDGAYSGAAFAASVEGVLDGLQGARVVGIDIPIGLHENKERRCDLKAREMLEGRWQSVFMTPPRAALEEKRHKQATRIAKELTGKGISVQAHSLRQKIFEVEAFKECADFEIIEVHPELCFAAMNGGEPLLSKRSYAGVLGRQRLLRKHGIKLANLSAEVQALPIDDVLDAAAAAWSAGRRDRQQVPENPEPGDPTISF